MNIIQTEYNMEGWQQDNILKKLAMKANLKFFILSQQVTATVPIVPLPPANSIFDPFPIVLQNLAAMNN